MPMSPSSPSLATISYGKRFSRSSASATGATSPSAKSRTVRRISSWSSERSKSMRASCPLLVQGRGQLDEQADAVAVAALGRVGLVRVPRGAGDVEVRPRDVADEALEELRRGDRRRAPVLDRVQDVAVPALDEVGVLGVQWQPPEDLAGPRSGRGALLAPRVPAAHHARVYAPERGRHRSGQRRKVD